MANTILIISDEHNPYVASPYGHAQVQTPAMERLAREGTVFDAAYCPSPLCLPSRSAMMAGQRVHQLQTYSNCNACLRRDYLSYGQALTAAGVHTAYIGKVDVYAPGDELGFSEMILPGDRALPGDTHMRRNPLRIREGAHQRASGYGPRPEDETKDERVTRHAVEWIANTAGTLVRPWLLCLAIVKPHFPHYVRPALWELYPDGGDLPANGPDHPLGAHPYARDLRDHFETDSFTEEQVRGLRRGYLGCVTHVDRQIGGVLTALEQAGLRDSTNVIYTSDHGDMLGRFGMWWKCSLYEDSVRVPLLAAGPDFAAGARVRTPVDLLDVQAALFDVLQVERPAAWAGTPLNRVPADDPERAVFAEYHGHGTRASAFMVRQGRWKLIYCAAAPNLLFDLETDPQETKDVLLAYPDVARRLEAELRAVCDPEHENERAEAFIEKQLATMEAANP